MSDILKELFENFVVNTPPSVDQTHIKGHSILWFGNMDAYKKSERRIVTVGLNPSSAEFDEARFEGAEKAIKEHDLESYGKVLNSYFFKNPYVKWFKVYNKVLGYMDASYGGILETQHTNTAIHIDCVPIATIDKWSKLSRKEKKSLLGAYQSHLKKILSCLNPDIVVVSVNAPIVNMLFRVQENEPINEGSTIGNGYIRCYRLNDDFTVADVGSHLLIWGKCWNVPFGAVKASKTEEVFKKYR